MDASVLIIEDDQNKLQQLKTFVQDVAEQAKVTERHSYQSGMSEVLKNDYDVVLLDMTMPTFDINPPHEDGGRPRKFGGREILRQMVRHKKNARVIVVTMFDVFGEGKDALKLDELDEQLHVEFPKIYLGLVYYDSAADEWKTRLRHFLRVATK